MVVSRRSPARSLRNRPAVEILEDRFAPAVAASFVNDNWVVINDIAPLGGAPSLGDTVRNDNDTVNPGSITGTFGVDAFASINTAIDNTLAAGTVNVLEGSYTENVVVDVQGLTLQSIGGRGLTTITGISNGAQGTVLVAPGMDNVTIGGTNAGFLIIGIDSPNPGIEAAALYYQGNHSGGLVRGNEIRANGDSALTTEFGATLTGLVIDGNIFSGQTFTGSAPAGDGFTAQFTLPNVPRPIIVIGGGVGGGNTSNITFTNNQITGIAGGISTTDNTGATVAAHEQGNHLATIDSVGAVITGNTFDGTTTRIAISLRARGPNTDISNNTFFSDTMTPTTGHVFVQNNETLDEVIANNTFDKAVWVSGATGTIGTDLQTAINAVPEGTVLHAIGTFPGNVDVNKAITLQGSFAVTGSFTVSDPEAVIQATVFASPLIIDAAGQHVFIRDGLIAIGQFGSQETIAVAEGSGVLIENSSSTNSFYGPNTQDRSALAGLTGTKRFVQSLYLNVLGRAGSNAELDGWVNTGLSQTALAAAIELSAEARTRLVTSWYQQYLGRLPGNGEEQGWVKLLQSGVREETVLASILGSGEFYARAQTLVTTGTANERYVQALYNLVLNRTASAGEVNGWVAALPSLGNAGVALNFLSSAEFKVNTIEADYIALLHRASDDPGAQSFANFWTSNNVDSTTIRLIFESSPEYFTNG